MEIQEEKIKKKLNLFVSFTLTNLTLSKLK